MSLHRLFTCCVEAAVHRVAQNHQPIDEKLIMHVLDQSKALLVRPTTMMSFIAAVMCAAACCSVSSSMRHSRKVFPPGMRTGNSCIVDLKFTKAAGHGLLFIGCVMSCQPLDDKNGWELA